jgi:RHS repeat-associated protein
VLASAILDRLLNHSTTINIKGESDRLKEKRKQGYREQKEGKNGTLGWGILGRCGLPDKRDFYSYNAANQLTEVLDQDANVTTFSYNATGALTGKTMGGTGATYSYNGMDKLTEAVTPTGTVNYAYDATGRRITRTKGGNVQNFIYGPGSDRPDYETNYAGELSAATLKGPDGMISLSVYINGSPSTGYQSYNPHGDTTLITGTEGQTYVDARYDAFGNTLDGFELSYGYTSKWQRIKDDQTLTIRMGVREYDPALGRFTSADPLKGDPNEPQQRNRYTYTSNNPLTRYDLDGRAYTVEDDYGRKVRLDQIDDRANAQDPFYGAGGRARFGADGNGAGECCSGWHWDGPGGLDMYFFTDDDCLWWDYHSAPLIGDEEWHCHAKIPKGITDSILDFWDWILQQNGREEVPGHPESRK